jgi:TldD protein
MDRRDFLSMSGIGIAGLMLPFGRAIAAEALLVPVDLAKKKALADAALAAATQAGASYCDVRVGRYLRQFVVTREDKVQNVVNTESTGVGIRVIAKGTWGFAATSELTTDAVARTTKQAIADLLARAQAVAPPDLLAGVEPNATTELGDPEPPPDPPPAAPAAP